MAKPIRMVTANLDFTNGPKVDRPYLQRLGGLRDRLGRPIVARPRRRILFLQEAKTGRVRRLLDWKFWGKQGNGEARSGTALVGRWVWLRNRRVWLVGDSRATLPRYATEAVTVLDGKPILVISVHVFPKRAGFEAQFRFLMELARRIRQAEEHGLAWAIGGDFNMDVASVARILRGQPFGVGIIGFVASKDVWVGKRGVLPSRGASDHPAYFIDVEKVA